MKWLGVFLSPHALLWAATLWKVSEVHVKTMWNVFKVSQGFHMVKPGLIPVSSAWSDVEYFYSFMHGFEASQFAGFPSFIFVGTQLWIHLFGEMHCERKVPCPRTWHNDHNYIRRELGPFNLESSALTITPLCSLHHYNKKEVVFKCILYHNGLLIVFLFSCRSSLNIVYLLQIHQPFPYIRLVLCDNTGPGQIEDPRKGGLRCGLAGGPGTSCLC